MGEVAKQYLLSPGTGTRRELDPVLAGAASVATAVTYGAAGTGSRRFSPESSNGTSQAVPAAPATFSGVGWEMDAAISSERIQWADQAWSASLEIAVTGATTGPAVTYTMIFFVNGAEIGRHSVSKPIGFTGAIDATFGMTVAELDELLVSSENPKLQIEVYANVTTAAVSVGTTTHTIRTNDADSFVDPATYQVRALRTISATAIGAVSMSRLLALKRLIGPAALGAVSLQKKISKPVSAVAIGAATLTKKISKAALLVATLGQPMLFKKFSTRLSSVTLGTPTLARRALLSKIFAANAIGQATMTRALTVRRLMAAATYGAVKIFAKLPIERIPGGSGAATIIRRIFSIVDD